MIDVVTKHLAPYVKRQGGIAGVLSLSDTSGVEVLAALMGVAIANPSVRPARTAIDLTLTGSVTAPLTASLLTLGADSGALNTTDNVSFSIDVQAAKTGAPVGLVGDVFTDEILVLGQVPADWPVLLRGTGPVIDGRFIVDVLDRDNDFPVRALVLTIELNAETATEDGDGDWVIRTVETAVSWNGEVPSFTSTSTTP
ncbi:MAG: hypothetical protein QOF57_2508 [Frankiaceae bacterium]|nr:hypothetical protein [Frankiaceae bacterium]